MKRIHPIRQLTLFFIGGIGYMLIELLVRRRTHWTMGILGGLCFVLIGLINEVFSFEMKLRYQALIACIIVTVLEFITGCIVNLHFGWGVWDYSNLPFNIMGQICLPFTVIWYFLSIFAIWLDDYIRWKIYGEEKPHYVF